MKATIQLFKTLLINSGQVDERQPNFLIAIAIFDAGFYIAMVLGHYVLSIAFLIVGFALSFKAIKMRRAWGAEQAENQTTS